MYSESCGQVFLWNNVYNYLLQFDWLAVHVYGETQIISKKGEHGQEKMNFFFFISIMRNRQRFSPEQTMYNSLLLRRTDFRVQIRAGGPKHFPSPFHTKHN